MIQRPTMFTSVKPEARAMMRRSIIEDLVRARLRSRMSERLHVAEAETTRSGCTIETLDLKVMRLEAMS